MSKSVQISEDVRNVLAAATVDGNAVKLNGQLERPLYANVDKVLKAMGGKWDRRAGAHVFANGFTTDLSAALEAGKVVDVKKTMEQFFTPPDVAALMARMIDVQPGEKVLEPSAGEGALIRAVLQAQPRCAVWAYEKDDRLREKLLADFYPQFGAGGLAADFNDSAISPVFDKVIMNPPFSHDMAHVTRAFQMLKPGGKLVAVMSPHWTFAERKAAAVFRDMVKTYGGWTPLPDATFRSAGTDVATGLCFLTKPVLA